MYLNKSSQVHLRSRSSKQDEGEWDTSGKVRLKDKNILGKSRTSWTMSKTTTKGRWPDVHYASENLITAQRHLYRFLHSEEELTDGKMWKINGRKQRGGNKRHTGGKRARKTTLKAKSQGTNFTGQPAIIHLQPVVFLLHGVKAFSKSFDLVRRNVQVPLILQELSIRTRPRC